MTRKESTAVNIGFMLTDRNKPAHSKKFCVSGGRRINPHLSTTIRFISGWPNTDEQQNIFSTFVSLIGFSARLDVFQMPAER